MKSVLLLEDGSCFEGTSVGVPGERVGSVVLNTAVVGYQENMTDPANAGKILVFTYPLIGNYGVAEKFSESRRCWIEGLVIKEDSRTYSNWQAETGLQTFLKNEAVPTLAGVDTRTLAVQIRDSGEMLGVLSTEPSKKSDLVKKLEAYKQSPSNSHIKNISVEQITTLQSDSSGLSIAILDLGICNSFITQLKTLGCNITLLPYHTDTETILSLKPDGVILSSGPEDDDAAPGVVEVTKGLLGNTPLLGISTGHEILCLALGAKLEKMKTGHHGVNYPVKSPSSNKGTITVQNHSFVVDEESFPSRDDITITLRNVDDHSIEEIESQPLRFISAQYYPTSPGLGEPHTLFQRFLEMIEKRKGI